MANDGREFQSTKREVAHLGENTKFHKNPSLGSDVIKG
jgi:hypothetical protein